MNPTNEVIEATEHVKEHYPQADILIVTVSGTYAFLDQFLNKVPIDLEVLDGAVIEKAVESVEGPFMYEHDEYNS